MRLNLMHRYRICNNPTTKGKINLSMRLKSLKIAKYILNEVKLPKI